MEVFKSMHGSDQVHAWKLVMNARHHHVLLLALISTRCGQGQENNFQRVGAYALGILIECNVRAVPFKFKNITILSLR